MGRSFFLGWTRSNPNPIFLSPEKEGHKEPPKSSSPSYSDDVDEFSLGCLFCCGGCHRRCFKTLGGKSSSDSSLLVAASVFLRLAISFDPAIAVPAVAVIVLKIVLDVAVFLVFNNSFPCRLGVSPPGEVGGISFTRNNGDGEDDDKGELDLVVKENRSCMRLVELCFAAVKA